MQQNQVRGAIPFCRQLSPVNCLLPADFGVFWQLQETGNPLCEGEPFGLGNLRSIR
jgi:hypothetical protein